MSESRPPFPPFTRDTAVQKGRGAEDAWNSCDHERVSLAYTPESVWRNRAEFIRGRGEIVAFLTRKWAKELDYRLIKELWAFRRTASPCALPMNGTMTRETGFAPTATRTGNSPRTG
jgi:nuclear transport factor 2 (NTF2) superfamily protein